MPTVPLCQSGREEKRTGKWVWFEQRWAWQRIEGCVGWE